MTRAISSARPKRCARKAAHAGEQARVDFALYGTIDPEEGAARILEQVEAGVAAFKFSTFGTDPKRFPRIPPALLEECFAAIAPTGLTAGVHNEDDEAVRAAIDKVKALGHHRLSRPWPVAAAADRIAGHRCRSTKPAPRPAARPMWCIARSAAATTLPRSYRDAGLRRHHRMLHPLPDARRGNTTCPARRQGQDQSADPPARRSGKALGACGGRQCDAGLHRSRELVGKPQDQSRHAGQRLGRAGAGSHGAALRQGRAGARHSADLGGEADGGEPGAAFPARSRQGRAERRARMPISPCCCRAPKVYDAAASGQQCRRLVAL